MNKLLHERLREYDGLGNFQCGNTKLIALCKLESEALADEIERYYIPRPRFEDGEPIEFGKRADILWEYDDECDFNSIEDGGIPVSLDTNFIASRAVMTNDGFVKRSVPKVLDADGVEINVGDTIYETHKDEPLTVYEVNSQYVHAKTKNGGIRGNLTACYITHEQPVFDADGVRICKGDTVWTVQGKGPYEVLKVEPSGWVETTEGYHLPHPEYITHRESDSYKAVAEWAREWANADSENVTTGKLRGALLRTYERLTALIEKSA